MCVCVCACRDQHKGFFYWFNQIFEIVNLFSKQGHIDFHGMNRIYNIYLNLYLTHLSKKQESGNASLTSHVTNQIFS